MQVHIKHTTYSQLECFQNKSPEILGNKKHLYGFHLTNSKGKKLKIKGIFDIFGAKTDN